MTSKLLNFIEKNDAWEELLEELHIDVKWSDNLVLLSYNMNADFSNPLVQEARGIILDIDKMEVVCWPFRKFGNYGEFYADEIDWKSAKVQEKLDGSIIKLWYYNDWKISTNGSFNAFGTKNNQGYDFGEMVFASLKDQNLNLCDLDKDYTYIFELVSPNNQIVVKYDKTMVYHIGTRNNKTGKEMNMDIGIIKPKEYPLTSLKDCIEFAKTFKAEDHEGFVVVDKNWNRIKVKSPDYIAAHHLRNNSVLTKKKIVKLYFDGDDEEYLTYFPDKSDAFNDVYMEIHMLSFDISNFIYDVSLEKLSRKDFGLKYHKHKYFRFAIDMLYNNKMYQLSKKFVIDELCKEENDEEIY